MVAPWIDARADDIGRRIAFAAARTLRTRGSLAALVASARSEAQALTAEALRREPPGRMACSEGCDACCYQRVVMSGPEVIVIARCIVETRSAEQVSRLRDLLDAQLHKADRQPCPLLHARRCTVYDCRPLRCEGHTGNDARQCHRLDHLVWLPQEMSFRHASGALAAGAARSGLGSATYELRRALLVALSENDVEARYLSGENIFAPAEFSDDDLTPEERRIRRSAYDANSARRRPDLCVEPPMCFPAGVRGWPALSVAVAVVALAPGASADEQPVSIDYATGPGCPGKDEFVARVLARTQRPRFVPSAPGVRGFVVRARAESGSATGSVAALGDRAGDARELRSGDCDEIVSALALIVALAVDPSASTTAGPRQVAAQATPTPEPVATAPVPPQPPAPKEPLHRPSPHGSWLLELHADTVALIAESPVPIIGASAAVEWQGERTGLVSPAARLSIGAGQSPTVHPAGGGAADFSVLRAAFDLSPVVFDLSRAVTLRPAVGFEAGRLVASGEPDGPILYVRPAATRPWLAVREVVRLQIECGRGWLFDLEGGAVEPLQRDTFEFHDPEITVLSVPRLAPTFAIGVSGRIS